MNEQTLFLAIFRAVDCLEEEQPNEEIKEFLDVANPYVFKDRKPVDEKIYEDYLKWIKENYTEINLVDSFNLAKNYVDKVLGFVGLLNAISEEEWKSLVELVQTEESKESKDSK